MKNLLTMLSVLWLAVVQTNAGTIIGNVRAEGKLSLEQDAECGKYDSRAFKFVPRVNYAEMRDFVVYIEGKVGTNKPPTPDKPVQVVTSKREISQKKATFTPHVLPVVVGTTVAWPNKDDI